ncbi:DEKNAAC101231 [Brettanomyces naardenensis]|uniref:DEKNAAC101231 n=1 Tax=Brettanomyces naardenensis TaxID=13370 RepID=A0A448YH95_BRENA|nr:DEKNAAC101231 [Brettanomyces naardenensis]
MSDPEIENVIEEGAISSVPRVGSSHGSSLLSSTVQFLQQEPQLSLLCGGLAGALSRTAVSPVERVKVLYQVQGPTNSYTKGTLRTVYQIWKEEGYKGLFRGNGINCIRIFPYSAVQYSVYMQLKAWYQRGSDLPESENLPTFEKLVAGGIAGFASVLVTYPMDLVKTRLSIQTATSLKNLNDSTAVIRQKPLGMYGSLKDIYKNEGGFRALYRGLMPTSCGVAPYVGLNFAIYESMKEAIDEKYRSNPIVILTMGALSGGIAQTMVYPFDILRRRFQVATLKGGKMGFQYKSTWDALRTIVVKEGVKGLFRGWQANMWKIMPSMAVQWASYDLIKEFLKGM